VTVRSAIKLEPARKQRFLDELWPVLRAQQRLKTPRLFA
jgi:hypothetical protein